MKGLLLKLAVSAILLWAQMPLFAAVGDPARYWPNGSTLNVLFLDGKPQYFQEVTKYASEWSKFANIKFRFSTSPNKNLTYHIRITFEGCSNASELGTDALAIHPSAPTMKLPVFNQKNKSQTRKRRVVLHEFGHALGLKHEHQNPSIPFERNDLALKKCIKAKVENISCYKDDSDESSTDEKTTKESIVEKCKARYKLLHTADFVFTKFDPRSIMMYNIDAGTIIGYNDLGIKKNSTLSHEDKKFIKVVYP